MRIAMASDHAGFEMKETLKAFLALHHYEIVDLSPGPPDPLDDYPDSAKALGLALRDNRPEHGLEHSLEPSVEHSIERGILICGSGVGACVAANKVQGIRAGICHDTYSAHQGVQHDDMNVLVLGGRIIGIEMAKELVLAYLGARFSGEARHVRRLAKVATMEQNFRS